jgi:hypothetical protein
MQFAVIGASCLGGLSLVTAVARRIAGPSSNRGSLQIGGVSNAQVDALRDEVDQLRAEVAELRARAGELDDVQNRLDFAERLLAQVREKTALPGPR